MLHRDWKETHNPPQDLQLDVQYNALELKVCKNCPANFIFKTNFMKVIGKIIVWYILI